MKPNTDMPPGESLVLSKIEVKWRQDLNCFSFWNATPPYQGHCGDEVIMPVKSVALGFAQTSEQNCISLLVLWCKKRPLWEVKQSQTKINAQFLIHFPQLNNSLVSIKRQSMSKYMPNLCAICSAPLFSWNTFPPLAASALFVKVVAFTPKVVGRTKNSA